MAQTVEVVSGELEITDTPVSVISTLTKNEVTGKVAEAQTKVDHLYLDTSAAELELAKWQTREALL
ncbi:MAG: hypothetical protein V3V74_07855 [Nitrosomonadaceae bacterium]